ncbi:transcriptional regulator, LysR family [Achromobacter piechaudii ATCC 43553]|uniref:Transcriptional regulator, LysR family n=1 Tax=Achromobacter piechaudii ATCC 43553 TaxID=742159 RepID=D4XEL1_9BURK|nr:transcriptional regulator, LysR family [Achromobacter piechaudii ATCC 43553]
MELRQLEAFAAVMSTGSVTAAGRLLGRSQPAISRLLQELEAEIGYALFSRSGPRVTPTEQGFLLYDDVERALAGLQQIRSRAEEIARGQAKPLLLAATSALAAGLLPDALKRIESQTGAARIQVRSASPERVVHAVLTGAAQLGATSLPLEHRGLTVHWIAQAPCVVALREDDPLAAHAIVRVTQLAGRRLITMANPLSPAPQAGRRAGARGQCARQHRNQFLRQRPGRRARRPGRVGAGTDHRIRRPHAGRGDPSHRPGHPFFLRGHHPAVATVDPRLPGHGRRAGRGRRRPASRLRPARRLRTRGAVAVGLR